MKPRLPILTILAALVLSALFLLGCEEETRYITTPDVPAVPVGVYSVTGDGYVDVYWQSNNDGGVTDGYGVYRYVGTNGDVDEYELLGTVDASSSQVEEYSYRDNGLQNGTTYWYAVNAYNGYGESELSSQDAFDTPRPQGSATLDLTSEDAMRLGWDFSQARSRDWQSVDAEVFFEYDQNLDAFFLWANWDDVYVQSYGHTDDLRNVNWGEPGAGWNNVGWVQLVEGHAYLVAMGEVDEDDISEHYAAVRVTRLDNADQELSFQWAYQTDPFNPELKRRPLTVNNTTTNTSGRSGN